MTTFTKTGKDTWEATASDGTQLRVTRHVSRKSVVVREASRFGYTPAGRRTLTFTSAMAFAGGRTLDNAENGTVFFPSVDAAKRAAIAAANAPYPLGRQYQSITKD